MRGLFRQYCEVGQRQCGQCPFLAFDLLYCYSAYDLGRSIHIPTLAQLLRRGLQSVDEVRSFVPSNPDLLGRHPLMHIVPSTTAPLGILLPQHDIREYSATKQAHHHVAEHGGVASPVSRLLLLEVDVGRDDTVEVAPADDDANDDAALVYAFDVVAGPGEGVGDRRWRGRVSLGNTSTGFTEYRLTVDSNGSQEGTGILDLRVARGKKHGETDDAAAHDCHIAKATLASLVRNPTSQDGHSCSHSVWWDRQQLCVGAGVTHASQDGWQEQAEGVQRTEVAHVDESVGPALPVLEGSNDMALVVLLGSARLVVGGKTAAHADTFLRSQEPRCGGPVEDHPPTESTDYHSSKTFNDEDPTRRRCQCLLLINADDSGLTPSPPCHPSRPSVKWLLQEVRRTNQPKLQQRRRSRL